MLLATWKVDADPNANWSGWSDFLAEVGKLPAAITSLAVAPLFSRIELEAHVSALAK